jgi:hypothetical protein
VHIEYFSFSQYIPATKLKLDEESIIGGKIRAKRIFTPGWL